jgi:hypothetical protein
MLPLMRFTSVRNVRSIVLNGVSCAPKFTVRGFAKYQELPNMVQPDDDPYFDASTMAVPWLRDSIRIEMYKKNKEDPKLWSAKNLSQHYKASYDRVVAVLTLLQLREKTITDDGFKFDLSTGEPVIPTKWQEVYDLSKSDKALNFSEIATACDMEGKGSDVKDIITRMKLHEIVRPLFYYMTKYLISLSFFSHFSSLYFLFLSACCKSCRSRGRDGGDDD